MASDCQARVDQLLAELNEARTRIAELEEHNSRELAEFKRMETRLRGESAKLGNIIASLNTGLSIINPDMTIDWVNDEVSRIFSCDDAKKGSCHDFFFNESEPCQDCGAKNTFQTGIPHQAEKRHPTTGQWFSISYKPLFDNQGRVAQVLEIFTDISSFKQAEEVLIKSELKWRHVLLNLPQIGISLTPQGTITFANDHFLRLTGWDRDEVMGQDWFEMFIPENQRPTISEIFKTVMAQKHTYGYLTYENEILTRSGEIRSIFWANVLTLDPEGYPADVTSLGVDLTERQRAEEALRVQRAELDSIFKVAPVGIGVVVERVITKVNEFFCRMTGYSAEELLGKSARIVYPTEEEYLAVGREKYRQITEHGSGMVETLWRRKDGRIINVLLSSTPLIQGDLSKSVTFTALDITESKQSEKDLKSALSDLEVIFNNSQVGIAYLVGGRHFHKGNQRLAEILGYASPEEMAGIPVRELHLNEASFQEFGKLYHETLIHGEQLQVEYQLRRKDGQPVWCRLSGKAVDIASPPDLEKGVVWIVDDISRSKAFEEALKETQEKFRLAFDSSPDAININRMKDGLYVEINQGFTSLTGFTAEDVFEKTSHEIGIWANEQDRERLVQALLLEGSCENLEAHFRRKDGSVTTALMSARVISLKGEPHILSITRDISKIKAVENELRWAKEQADSANKAKSEFLANMSHELRTPLNGLMGMLQLLNTTSLDQNQSEFVDHALKSSRRLLSLLSDILDLSRIEAGKMAIAREAFDFKDAMDAIVQLFEPSAREKGLELRVSIDPGIPSRLIGDALRLQQILTNLVGNAIKFTSKGYVEISAHPLPGISFGECRLLFSVMDTGIGIADNMLAKLFAPFAQVEGNLTRKFQGAGLGLSISKKLVALMGGNMALESEEGKGSSFHFSIPFDLAEPCLFKLPSREKAAVSTGLKVLLAEDDPTSQLVLVKLFERLGHQIQAVEDGMQALARLKAETYDLVLMDVQMPVLDGVDATRAIRSGEAGDANRHIPIVAMTAFAMTGDRENFLKAGMDGYLAKPVEMEALQELLVRIMKARGQA